MTTEHSDFDAAWDYSDPAGTEARFRAMLPELEAAGDRDAHAQLLTQIARTHGMRGEFAEAHAILDEVNTMLSEETITARVRSLLERGRAHNSSGERERATELFRGAFELANGSGIEEYAADALHMLGISTPADEALAWNQRAIEYCEGCTDKRARRWLGPLYHNTWVTHIKQEECEIALSWAEKSRAFRESVGDVRGERIGRWCIHHTWRKLGRYEEALGGLQALLAEYAEAGQTDGYCREELGECLLALDRAAEAQPHFAAAFEELKGERWIQEGEPERLERMRRLGGL